MYPISYTVEGSKVIFSYDEKDLAEWHKRGKEHGDAGPIMVSIENKQFITYHTYGTIENPCTDMYQLSLVHSPIFDGELEEPEYYLKPVAEERVKQYWADRVKTMKLIILDVSDDKQNLSNGSKT